MMPVVSASITEGEWRAWDEEFNLKPKSLNALALEGHWVLDGLDADARDHVEHLVPPVPRFILIKLLARSLPAQAGDPVERDGGAPRAVAADRGGPDMGGRVTRWLPAEASVETEVMATPSQVWEVLTDVTRVGEWSHECHTARWLPGHDSARVGAQFAGRNRNGPVRWGRRCTITEVEPERRLVYRTRGGAAAGLDRVELRARADILRRARGSGSPSRLMQHATAHRADDPGDPAVAPRPTSRSRRPTWFGSARSPPGGWLPAR